MEGRNERIRRVQGAGQQNGGDDTFCRTVVASVAAILAVALCRLVKRLKDGLL